MRQVNFLTWNTQMYEMGNKLNDNKIVKKIDENVFKCIIGRIKCFLNSHTDAIAVLQEIPYKCNTDSFKEHIVFRWFREAFPNEKYSMIYNISSPNQIKMTVVLSNKKGCEEQIYKNTKELNNNMCVSFGIKGLNFSFLGVHPHNAHELYKWLQKFGFPDIIIGDFNAGDYKKSRESDIFKANRDKYRLLSKSYKDICNGQITRREVYSNGFVYETPIDHVLVHERWLALQENQYKDLWIKEEIKDNISDHYPIYFKLLCSEEN